MKQNTPLQYLGMAMFFISWPIFGLGFLVPFWGLSLAQGSMAAGGLFLLAEMLFWGSLLILGKSATQSLKERFQFWEGKEGQKKQEPH